ncbi:MFS transporter [Streptomyces shenzhenensis]|uniref:MFS transporter n=1 Tax=Streptomyces shenzhenensis TaxID=943815 RepID=UPI0038273711
MTVRRRTFASLAEHDYRLYAAGALISDAGTWLMNTAMAWLVLLSAHAGVLADRFAKDANLRVMQVVMAVPAAVLGVLAVLDAVVPWQVYLLAFASGVGRALEAPARHAIVSELVGHERLGNAVALNSASFNAGRPADRRLGRPWPQPRSRSAASLPCVAAIYGMVFVGSVPLVAPVVGWVGDAFGPRAAVVLSGLVAGVGVVGEVARYATVSARVAPR